MDDKQKIAQGFVASDKRMAEMTGNPIYIWDAILRCRMAKMPLPEWCLEYIEDVAINIHDLARLVNFRVPITRQEDESDEAFGSRMHARYSKRQISAKQAKDLLPQAMRFTAGGKNQFRNWSSDEMAMATAAGADADLIFKQRKRESKGDLRTLKRKIKRGRELSGVAKPTT